jgi:hypothetical protein
VIKVRRAVRRQPMITGPGSPIAPATRRLVVDSLIRNP